MRLTTTAFGFCSVCAVLLASKINPAQYGECPTCHGGKWEYKSAGMAIPKAPAYVLGVTCPREELYPERRLELWNCA